MLRLLCTLPVVLNNNSGLNLHLETRRARASKGGMGATKCAGNYGAALKPLMDCKKHGFHDNLFLELETYHKRRLGDAVLQEMSAANVFLVLRSGEVVTPSLDRRTVLPGVTRDSVLKIVNKFTDELLPAMRESTCNPDAIVRGSSRTVTVLELQGATECFCTGTAAELVPIYRLATSPDDVDESFKVQFDFGRTLPGGPVTCALLKMLRESMTGKRHVEHGWLRDPFAMTPEEFAA